MLLRFGRPEPHRHTDGLAPHGGVDPCLRSAGSRRLLRLCSIEERLPYQGMIGQSDEDTLGGQRQVKALALGRFAVRGPDSLVQLPLPIVC